MQKLFIKSEISQGDDDEQSRLTSDSDNIFNNDADDLLDTDQILPLKILKLLHTDTKDRLRDFQMYKIILHCIIYFLFV